MHFCEYGYIEKSKPLKKLLITQDFLLNLVRIHVLPLGIPNANLCMLSRRKSALPKYDPPYLKRPIIPGKGYSHPNSPHPSQHIPPLEQTNLEDPNNKMANYTPTPAYRSVE